MEAKNYLTQRELSQDVIDHFEIGYAPDQNILLSAFEKSGFTKMQAYASGLVIESQVGYDRYHDRIMFPLHNSEGRVVGFSGRIYRSSQKEAKYMNSPESSIFIKGDTLYNYHRVKESVRDAGKIIVLEGFMDVIALYKAGIKNAVAIMGTALTSNHLRMLKRLSNDVVLCLDGDQAGKNAMMKCIDAMALAGFNIGVVVIPDQMDPDEFLKAKGKDELNALFKNPQSAIDFKMSYHYERINVENYEDRKKYLESMVEMIATLDDLVDRDYYIEQLVKKSGFSKEIIYQLLSQKPHEKKPIPFQPITYDQSTKMIDKYQKAERNLLYYMMQNKSYAMQYEAKAGYMYDKINRLIASYIIDYYRQYVVLEIADLISMIDDDEIVKRILEISSQHLPKETSNQAIDDYIKIIQEKMEVERIKQLESEMAQTYDPRQQAKILQEIINSKEKE